MTCNKLLASLDNDPHPTLYVMVTNATLITNVMCVHSGMTINGLSMYKFEKEAKVRYSKKRELKLAKVTNSS